jgi:Spy/CpxP family protein refolding chaperone
MKTRHLAVAGLILCFGLGFRPAVLAARQGDPQARWRLRERISDLYLLRLTRALDLTEDQTAKLYPLLTRVEKEKAELQRGLGLDLRDLREELARTPAGEKTLMSLVEKIRRARLAIRVKDDEVEAVLERVLTPVQRARYLVFTVDFLRTVGENLDRVRGGGRGLIKRTP